MTLQLLDPNSAEYYVSLKKSGCALSPEGRLKSLSPRLAKKQIFW